MRDVAHHRNTWITPARLSWLMPVLVAVAGGLAPQTAPAAGNGSSEGAQVRIVSYQSESSQSGDASYFAASIQPSANDALLAEVKKPAADVVVVVDTSASQSGEFRRQSLAALDQVLITLRPQDRVQLFAADVRAVALSESLVAAGDSAIAEAKQRLNQRLPLGHTNMVSVIDAVRGSLVAGPQRKIRSIIYIGDAASIDAAANETRFAALVDALRADHVSVHSIAIGPSTNIELMAVLANHTGGVLGAVGQSEGGTAEVVARQVTESATMSPIWLQHAKLPAAMTIAHGNRIPPLRVDRDSILIGQIDGSVSEVELAFRGATPTANVTITADASVESSNPDFSFLPGLVANARENQGLTLPTASSFLLRQTAKAMAAKADELVRAGKLALQRGNKQGAKAVAEMALEADAENEDAKAIKRISGTTLIVQNDGALDDLFGSEPDAPATPAPPADDNPFGDAAPAQPAPAQPAPAEPAPAEPAPAPPAADPPAPTPPAPTPPPAPPAADEFGGGRPPMVPPSRSIVGDDEILERGGELLERIEAETSAAEGRLRAEVRAALRAAERKLRADPTGVAGQLKSVLSRVQSLPDVDPKLRQDLESQLQSAIQAASAAEARFLAEQANIVAQEEAARAKARLLEATFRREATLQTLSQQMNALIDEGRYTEADGEVSLKFAEIAGDSITEDSVAGRHFTDQPLALQTYDRDRRYKEMRERNFVDAFSLVLKSNIPFVDEPPILYPDADVWQELSRYRLQRYGSIELIGGNEAERKIEQALSDETTQTFIETPLSEAVQRISDTHEIPIVIDRRALEEIGLDADVGVNIDLKNVSLRSFLRLMLRDLDLTYVIKDEVMQITTVEQAEDNLVTKVYPVGDLVVPVMPIGGGGMMGGMMGGMGGGMMGGMGGGMMGGMGGMGGMGMGGMGGGMGMMGGGGAFVVPDTASLSDKAKASASGSTAGTEPSAEADKPADRLTAEEEQRIVPIKLNVKEGQTRSEAWREFFASVKLTDVRELTILDQRVRSTVALYSRKASKADEAGDRDEAVRWFQASRELIGEAIRAGQVQPWMYQAYAIALTATGAPSEDVERTLLSAVDFAETPGDILHVAARLEDLGSDAAALRLCQRVAEMEPNRREPYVMGLRLAENLGDSEAITWACEGVLSQAWPAEFSEVVDKAKLLARSVYGQLIESGKTEEAARFGEKLKLASAHDVVIRVSWTGEADIDLSVEEPGGTICSLENRSSAGGGTLLGDSYPGYGEDQTGNVSEMYVCPKGFSGQYRLLVRKVWGEVSTGQVTVEIVTDAGRKSQRFIRKEIPLTEKDALFVFDVKEGKRKEKLGEAQLAHLRDVQRDLNDQLLGQFAAPGNNSAQVLSDLYSDVQRLTGGFGPIAGNPFFGRGNAVGFQPQITQLPEGASLMTLAIISADRRYVRIAPAPFFSQVGDVSTFNFVDGTGGGAGGGGGLGGGGLGGGLGGGGLGGGLGGGGLGGGLGGGGLGGGGLGGGFGGGGLGGFGN